MTEREDGAPRAFALPAALQPADAKAAHAALLAARDTARAEGATLEIALDGAREGAPVLPCALQILAAARASIARDGPRSGLRLAPEAEAALAPPG